MLRHQHRARHQKYLLPHPGKIVWENNFIENCRIIGEEFEWANDMIELLTNC
jgi:hypothetical protein